MNSSVKIIVTLLLCFISMRMEAQSAERAFRNIEKGEYDKALVQLQKLYSEDSLNVLVNVGMAVLFSTDSFPGHNYFQAWQRAITADRNFSALQEKEKETLNGFLFDLETHKSSFPVKQKYDNLYKDIEDKLIKYVREEKDLAMVREFLVKFPNSKYYENVLHIRNYLEFGQAQEKNTIAAYEAFVSDFPDAAQVPQAIETRDQLAYNQAVKSRTLDAVNQFILKYPKALQHEEAIRFRNELAFEQARKTNTIEAWVDFLKNYPDAVQAPAALKLKRQLVYEKAKQVNSFEAYSDFIKNYPEGEQFVDVFNLRANALASRYFAVQPLLATGKIAWIRGFDFSGRNDLAGGLASDAQGDVICSGSSSAGESGYQEAWVMKLTGEGKLVWNKSYPANQGCHAAALQVSVDGNIYFSGYSITDISQGQVNGWIGKLNPEGFRFYDHTTPSADVGQCLLLNNKELALGGYHSDSIGMPHYWLALLKENGKNIWTRDYSGKGMVQSLINDPSDALYVAGGSWCFKADHAGYLVWEYFPSDKDSMLCLSLTPAGETNLAGINTAGQLKYIRLNKLGKKAAEKLYPEYQNMHVFHCRSTRTGEIYLSGIMNGTLLLLKIADNGTISREFSWNGSADAILSDFLYLPDGSRYILIGDHSPDTGGDVLLVKLIP